MEYLCSHSADPWNTLVGHTPSMRVLPHLTPHAERDHEQVKNLFPLLSIANSFRVTTIEQSDPSTDTSQWNDVSTIEAMYHYILRWNRMSRHPARVTEEIAKVSSRLQSQSTDEIVAVEVSSLPNAIRFSLFHFHMSSILMEE